jgi:SAM-dependent methyltransferase
MSDELYSNYVNREPLPRNAAFIARWHKRLLMHSVALNGLPRRVLEIGPGHGYFASACREQGLDYTYCDTSPSVHRKMNELGFSGQLGLLHELEVPTQRFDLIWMSHVLEHSPTWLDARSLVDEAKNRLAPGGSLVVISPDILSWRREFWNVDWSHGYPTSLRNVSQLMDDVGLDVVDGRHHRNASFFKLTRAVFWLLTSIPHRLVDRLLTPERFHLGDGMCYSWKAVFGWRQIFVVGRQRT